MKMKNQLFWILPLFFVFIACQNQPEDTINIEKSDYTLYTLGRLGLDEDTEWQILLSCQKKLKNSGKNVAINDIWIEKYYGPYCPAYKWTEWCESWTYPDNGVLSAAERDAFYAGWDIFEAENRTLFAVVIGYEGQDTEQWIMIENYSARALVKNGNNIFLWHDGKLSEMKNMINSSWFVAPFLEDFLSIANGQNGLELQTQIRIQEDYGKAERPTWDRGNYKSIRIQYLGTYNGYIIMKTHMGHNTSLGQLTVGDVYFSWSRGDDRIFAWKDGEIFELTDLYEQGLITREDLVAIRYQLRGE